MNQDDDSLDNLKSRIEQHLKSLGAFQPLIGSAADRAFVVDELYSRGYYFYENGKYPEATDFFKMLTQIDAENPNHWTGLGACFQMQKLYNEALIAYSTSLILDSTNATNFFHAANCCFALNHVEEGIKALSMAESLAHEDPKYKGMLEQLAMLKERWSNVDKRDIDTKEPEVNN